MVPQWLRTLRVPAVRVLVGLALIESAWLLYTPVRTKVLALEDTPAARGQRLAENLGCFGCHGPGGNGGVHNVGSEEGEVPAFTEQTQMMYVKSIQDLRDYVLDGAPRRRLEDTAYQAKVEAAALRMPAYRTFLSADQVEDLVAFLRASSGQILPESGLAAHGAELATQYGCFSCHGPLGAGGVKNPASFKGYIPAFCGDDFGELVRDDQELTRWIGEGKIARIAEHPIGRIFFNRQAIKMPAYRRFLSEDDLAALVAYVRWICTEAPDPLRVAAR